MAKKSEKLQNLEEAYELQLEEAVEKIKNLKICSSKQNKNHKKPRVLLQFPDGLKNYSIEIANYLKEKTCGKAEILIWLGSCFGACDIPGKDADLLIQFGHAPWKKR